MSQVTREQDVADKLAILSAFGPFTKRCKGGRLIADGYMCIHCGADPDHECRWAGVKETPATEQNSE